MINHHIPQVQTENLSDFLASSYRTEVLVAFLVTTLVDVVVADVFTAVVT